MTCMCHIIIIIIMALSLKHKQQPEYRMNEKMDRNNTYETRKKERDKTRENSSSTHHMICVKCNRTVNRIKTQCANSANGYLINENSVIDIEYINMENRTNEHLTFSMCEH